MICMRAIVLLADISPITNKLIPNVQNVPVNLHDKVLTILLGLVSINASFRLEKWLAT